MNYLEWNNLLAKYFFNEEKSGKEVLLYVNEDLINELGKPRGDDINNFLESTKQGPRWITRSGVCQKALQSFEGWRNKGFEYPPYISYLACFVLAAGTHEDCAPQAYYPRLRKLLNEEDNIGQLPSFNKMILLWDDLDKWSREDKQEELGRFVTRIRGNWCMVGLPLSQTVLSEDEKKRLPVIFERADIDPSDPPSPEIMIKLLRYHGEDIFEKRTRRLLNLKQGDDAILKNKLVELVLEELEDWDGTINDISKRAGEKESYIIPAGLRICIELDSISKRASAYVRLKTNRLYPEEGLRFESVSFPGSSLFCNEVFQGWSKPIKINDGSTKLNAADIDWTRGIQLEDKMHKWHARLKRDTVRLFISGKSEKLPGWIETQKLERGISFVIAAYAEASDKVRYWGEQSCESFCELNYSGLPKGWSIFKGINAHGSCKDVDVLSLSSALRLLLRGGIKIRGGNTYLKTAPPLIILENCSGMETVRMNGMPLAKLDKDSHIWMLPEDTPTKEILKIEVKVGEEELRRVLRLEEPMLANSFEEAPWRDIRGDICSSDSEMYKASGAIMKLPNSEKYISHSACLKPDSSKHMFFIGILSGQIVEWPQEDLPVDWEPVWVVEKMRRKEWKVNYCRESLDIIKNHGEEKNPDRSKVKKWKEIVWVKRKITRCPKIPLVRKKWMKFVEAARNV